MTALVCDRCDRVHSGVREIGVDEGGAVVRDKGSATLRRFRACPSCAEALKNQVGRARGRAENLRARARGTSAGREVAAVLDAIDQQALPLDPGRP